MTKQQVITFLTEGFVLANLPDSFMKLRRVENDPHSDIDDVVEIARKDVELSASLLKLANSSLYNRGKPVGTIEEAAQMLGLRLVVESSLALGIIKKIEIDPNCFDLAGYWKRSLSVASLTEEIYKRAAKGIRSIVQANLLYTAGLLHDIGLLALLQGFTDEMVSVVDIAISEGVPIQEVEQREFGFTHQDVGRILFKKWNLPEEMQCVAAFHHRPLELKRRLYYPLVDLVYISDFVCCGAGSNDTPSAFKPVLFPEVWGRSRMSLELVDELADRVDQLAASADAILAC